MSPAPRGRGAGIASATAALSAVEVVAVSKLLLSLAVIVPALSQASAFVVGEAAAHVAVFAAAGAILCLAGRRDRRAVALGAFFLVLGTAWTDLLLRGGQDALDGSIAGQLCGAAVHLPIFAFAPALLWVFVRDFPRRLSLERREIIARASIAVCSIVGACLIAANLWLALRPGSVGARVAGLFDRANRDSLFLPTLIVPGLPALVFAGAQVRAAPVDEQRRARLMTMAICAGLAPEILASLLAATIPPLRAQITTGQGWVVATLLLTPPMLAIPFVVAYAVLVHHALDVRLIVRRALQYALARWTLRTAVAVPFAVLLLLVYARREQSLATVASGGTGVGLLALAGLGAMGLRFRRPVLAGLDRRYFREQYDARAVLGGLVEGSRGARDAAELAALVPAEIDRALHVHSSSLLLLDAERQALVTPNGRVPPLPLACALGGVLARAEATLETDWSRPDQWMTALPAADQEWLAAADARLLVPVADRGGSLMGAIVLGEKRSEMPFSREDRQLLQTIAGSVALAADSQGMLGAGVASSLETEGAAAECPDCGLVFRPDLSLCTRCGAGLVPSAVPALLAGKYRALERLGRGGMGVVYRALDTTLDREVALKTLPAMAPAAAARLRREASAMAAVSHPNLAAIHSAESWRGSPILVVELLAGGTLQPRLRHGRLAAGPALELGTALAQGLACLHDAGMLHRDIKPSNIGFAGDGTPKLLDFGLARLRDAAQDPAPALSDRGDAPVESGGSLARLTTGLVGTLPYLSPEAVRGAPATIASDLWALSLVVYEAMAGRNPLQAGTAHWMLYRIARADIPRLELTADCPQAVVGFLAACLDLDPHRRPATARDWMRAARQAHARGVRDATHAS